MGVDLLIDLGNRCVDGIDLLEVQPQHEAVMFTHPAAQRLAKLLRRRPRPSPRIKSVG